MKILLVSSNSGSQGGGEIYLLYLGKSLAGLGHTPVLWASDSPEMDQLCAEFKSYGTVVRHRYRNTYKRRLRSLTTYLDGARAHAISKAWRELDPDIIHVNKQNLEDGLDLLLAANRSNTPTVSTIHLTQSANFLKARLAWPRDFTAKHFLRRYRGSYITVQERRATDLRNFLNHKHTIYTVENGVPIPSQAELDALRNSTRKKLMLGIETPLIIGVGRMMPQKRPELFLDLAAQIRESLPNVQFIWIGGGQLDSQWDHWVAAKGLKSCVHHVDWTRDTLPYIAAADYFLHTAEYEGLPLALLEAMAAGLPCMVTMNLLNDMPFLNCDNSIAITGKDWLKRITDAKDMQSIGREARELVRQKYSNELMARNTLVVYRNEINSYASQAECK